MLDTEWVLEHLPKQGRPFTEIECYASWVQDQFNGKKYSNREYAKIWMISESKAYRLMLKFEEILVKQKRNKSETQEVSIIKASQVGCETKVKQKRNNNKLKEVYKEKEEIYIPENASAEILKYQNPVLNKKTEDPKINIDGTDFVKMTQKQIDKLKENLGKERAIEMIIRLDGYIGQIGEKKASKLYNSHYHTILNWHRKDISEGRFPK